MADDGTLLASAKRYRYPVRLDRREGWMCGIGAVFTPPSQRGRGRASQIVEHLVEQSRREGGAAGRVVLGDRVLLAQRLFLMGGRFLGSFTLRGLRDRAGLSKIWHSKEREMTRCIWALLLALVVTAPACSTETPEQQAPQIETEEQAPAEEPQAESERSSSVLGSAAPPELTGQRSPGAGPVIIFETVKGTFEIETYPNEAPQSVEHILALVKRNFYNGLRVHRLVPGFVVQFGDPQTRDFTRRASWGNGGSGRPIGVAEISPKRPHRLGAVALAHGGDPRGADSQMYLALAGLEEPRIKNIQGDFAVIGQVISGMDVVRTLEETDVIRRATVVE